MKQWVVLDEWGSKEIAYGDISKLEVTFSLANPANFLIALNRVEIEFSPELPERYYLVRNGTPLPPAKPLTMKLPLPITPERMNTFKTGTLGISVTGSIVFVSALDKEITQNFSGLLSCSLNKTTLESTITLCPTSRKDCWNLIWRYRRRLKIWMMRK